MKLRILVTPIVLLACGPGAPPETPQVTPAAEQATPAPKAPDSQGGSILGTWVACDERLITFKKEEDKIVGRYSKLTARMTELGFSVGDIGYEFVQDEATGKYVGTVTWRFDAGRVDKRKNEATVEGDSYEDTASDRCSKKMTRAPAGS